MVEAGLWVGPVPLVGLGATDELRQQGWQVPKLGLHSHPTTQLTFLLCGGDSPSFCGCARGGPPPSSEQLCPLRPQAAQPLGALLPRAAPRPAGPTGQVLALALGQVTYLLSPQLPGVSASVPRRPSSVCVNSPETDGVAEGRSAGPPARPRRSSVLSRPQPRAPGRSWQRAGEDCSRPHSALRQPAVLPREAAESFQGLLEARREPGGTH